MAKYELVFMPNENLIAASTSIFCYNKFIKYTNFQPIYFKLEMHKAMKA